MVSPDMPDSPPSAEAPRQPDVSANKETGSDLATIMRATIDRTVQRDAESGDRLLMGSIGEGDKQAIIFRTPADIRAEGNLESVGESFLVATLDGFKLIQAQNSGASGQTNTSRLEFFVRQANILQDGYKKGYVTGRSGIGWNKEHKLLIYGESNRTSTGSIGENEHNSERGMRLVSEVDPNKVTEIVQLNKKRVDEELDAMRRAQESADAKVRTNAQAAQALDQILG